MALALPLLLSVGLTFAWLWLFVRRDRHPEPPRLLARTFGWAFAWWGIGLYWWAGVLYAWQVRTLLRDTPRRTSSAADHG